MKGIEICCMLILSLIVLRSNAQNQQIWIGENLTEIILEQGKWSYQSEKRIYEIKEVNSEYFVVDEISQEPRYKIGFYKLEAELDTIILQKGLKTLLFVRPDLFPKKSIKFHSFEFSILDPSGCIDTKYHLNKYRVFRKSNFKNETLIESNISRDKLAEFVDLLHKLDVRNMNKAEGLRNNCDREEYSFTVWENDGRTYNYIGMDIRKQLLPIKDFIIKMEK